ncbi:MULTISPECIES: hypothetical protein [Dietzia]|uniref:Cardiolipin synthase N-terminal domain-containing protein n=1 Tax=Dietzia cinnamea TaxID=321318 RepID=A0ABV3YM96_9ACTN|nr:MULTISPECIES: hypothetical protein [Dietzia]AVM65226.1 hypothetical protein C3V38_13495 [Dietzia sp. oral taxon 368]MBM7231826.1 hypothetical protein [Dietzia cinnamea]MCT1639391.1 hypothetical protein [Dietzia cinnamea]MCT1713322.1 hypothetical protein [Dietzia cinnamea]MCT1865294.1 hypothetical protein [Dietzia cinnamea]
MTVAEAGTAAVIPLAYDIVWLLVVLVWLLIPIAIAVTERRRGASWPETFLWFMVAFLLPVVGLIVWALYRTVGARRATSR